jgi:hypothetical protein
VVLYKLSFKTKEVLVALLHQLLNT